MQPARTSVPANPAKTCSPAQSMEARPAKQFPCACNGAAGLCLPHAGQSTSQLQPQSPIGNSAALELRSHRPPGRHTPTPAISLPSCRAMSLQLPNTHPRRLAIDQRRPCRAVAPRATAAYSPTATARVSPSGSRATSLRSPNTLSTRLVVGQNLAWRTHAAGNAARSRLYGRVHSLAITTSAVCGACFSTLSSLRAARLC